MVGNACNGDEYCVDSNCVCRPPTVDDGMGGCLDPATNPDACGTAGTACGGGTPNCAGGTCVMNCPGGTADCNNSCVDLDTDPQNCGACGDNCDVEQVCVNGNCEDFRAGSGCTTCPCTACVGDFSNCCSYPGTTDTICVNGGDCP